jgi:hypothetical protein
MSERFVLFSRVEGNYGSVNAHQITVRSRDANGRIHRHTETHEQTLLINEVLFLPRYCCMNYRPNGCINYKLLMQELQTTDS